MLTGQSVELQPSHYYIKFLPNTGQHILDIANFEETFDYEFDAQPIHYEVIYEGEEGYIDPSIPDSGGFGPEFGAVKAIDFPGNLPNVPFQVLEPMFIPDYLTRLAFVAFVISGNEQYFEGVDGLCHPDCPTWPTCLEFPELTCEVDTVVHSIVKTTIHPQSFQSAARQNFPAYILDQGMGPNEDVVLYPLEEQNPCEPHCLYLTGIDTIVINNQVFHTPYGYCHCLITSTPVPPTIISTPEDQEYNSCDCLVYDNPKKPGGRIMVEDTQLTSGNGIGDEGVKWIKVKSTRHHWGFIYRTTDTDENGCWKIDKSYDVKNAKFKFVFRDRIADRLIIRSVRNLRFWNAMLKPVKYAWKLKRKSKQWNDLCLVFHDKVDYNTKGEEAYVASHANNAYHEFFDELTEFEEVDSRIHILIHTISGDLNTAPMFIEMGQDALPDDDVGNWFASFEAPFAPPFQGYWHAARADVFLSYKDDRRSDVKRRIMYHEFAHCAQYQQLGTDWWEEMVEYIFTRPLVWGAPLPYGQHGDNDPLGHLSTLVELSEGLAEAVAMYVTHRRYGANHSLDGGGLISPKSWINQGERLRYVSEADTFIPEGLFFDLFDGGSLTSDITVSEGAGINDAVDDQITFEDQLSIYHYFMRDVEDFRDELWLQVAQPAGVNQSDYFNLFASYGY